MLPRSRSRSRSLPKMSRLRIPGWEAMAPVAPPVPNYVYEYERGQRQCRYESSTFSCLNFELTPLIFDVEAFFRAASAAPTACSG